MSLQKKLKFFMYGMMIPFIVLILFQFFLMDRFSKNYANILKNVTTAGEFNKNFKENVDWKMYQIVVGSGRYTMDDLDPYIEISDARGVVDKLKATTSTTQGNDLIQMTSKCLDNLDTYIKDIGSTYKVAGNYDKNMDSLDNNIRIVTELIQENISNYIYYETLNLNSMSSDMQRSISTTIMVSLLVFIIMLGVIWILIINISNSITKPIGALCDDIKQVGLGDFTTRAAEDDNDEIRSLSYSFNRMVEKIGSLVEDVKIEQEYARDTELKLLQAQINPHFLYNTLDTIVWLAEDKQNEQVIEMVTALSEFFRTSLSKGRDYITIAEEKSHIESYLKIQQFRYQDILEYEINIPMELMQYKVLKLTLQPLVENALYHGIKTRRSKGRIYITGKYKDGKIFLSVEDDGTGMTEETLISVKNNIYRKNLDPEDKSLDSFGLYNVNERIKLNYGEEFGLKINSLYGEGTTATVIIPAMQ